MNKKLYLDSIRQLKIPGVIGTVIFSIIAFFTSFGATFLRYTSEYYDIYYLDYHKVYVEECLFSNYLLLFLAVGLIFVPVLMMVQFSFLLKRNSSDFYHVLPIKRQGLFFSFLAAVMTWAVVMMVIPALIIVVVYAINPHYYLGGDVLITLLTALIIAVLVAGVFSVGVSCTGTVFTNLAVSAMLLVVPRAFLTAIVYTVSELTNVLPLTSGGFFGVRMNALYSIGASLFTGLINGSMTVIPSVGSLIYTAVLGILYLLLGMFLFTKRKSETASQPSVNHIAQSIIRMIPAFCFSLVGTVLLVVVILRNYGNDREFIFTITIFYVCAVVVYFLYELVTTKRWKSLGKSAKQLPILIGLNVVVAVGMITSYESVMNKQLDPEKIQAVEFEMVSKDSWSSLFYKDLKITDEEVIRILTEAYNETLIYMKNMQDGFIITDSISMDSYAVVTFYERGRHYSRCFYFTDEQGQQLLPKVLSLAQNGEKKLTLPAYDANTMEVRTWTYRFDLLHEDDKLVCAKLYESLRDEITTVDEYLKAHEEGNDIATVRVSIADDNDSSLMLPINTKTPKTLSLLADIIAEADQETDLNRIAQILKEENQESFYYEINICSKSDGWKTEDSGWSDSEEKKVQMEAMAESLAALLENEDSSKWSTYEDGDLIMCITLSLWYYTDDEGGEDAVMVTEEYDPDEMGDSRFVEYMKKTILMFVSEEEYVQLKERYGSIYGESDH